MPAGWPQNQVTKEARAKSGGGFESAIEVAVVGDFVAETGFSLLDNGDGTLKITDSQSRFGAKPNAAKPVWFFDFGSGSDQPHPTLSRQQKTILWSSQCIPTQVVAKAGSTHSMTIDTEAADNGESVFSGTTAEGRADKTLTLPANSGGKFYRYYDVYNDFLESELQASAPTGPNFKTHRWQSDGAQVVSGAPYLANTIQDNLYRANFVGDGEDIYSSQFYDMRNQLTVKAWNIEEEYHQVSSAAGATDAVMYGLINSELKFTRANIDSHNGYDPASESGRWNHYKLGNFRWWATPGVAPWRANVLYIDDSWCRVYITDKPTWVNTETRAMEIQVPVGWASAQVDFHQRTGALGSLSGKYLWVTDNNDTKILVGGWS